MHFHISLKYYPSRILAVVTKLKFTTEKISHHVLFDAVSCCHFQTCLAISAGGRWVGTQVWNNTTFMALPARLPWLTALVLPQWQLETPLRKRLSRNEPPRRERAINGVYFWTKFVCVGEGGINAFMCILNLCIHVYLILQNHRQCLCVCVCLRRCILESICGIGLWKWFGIHMRGFEFLAVNVFQGDD